MNSHQLDQAQNAYVHALYLFPNGKKANLGLAKVLVTKCEQTRVYCEEAAICLEKVEEFRIRNRN